MPEFIVAGLDPEFNRKMAELLQEKTGLPFKGADETKLDAFMKVYASALSKAHYEHPVDYAYPADEITNVLIRMRVAIEQGTFNKDSPAFKATCRALGIKHTYKAIKEYLS